MGKWLRPRWTALRSVERPLVRRYTRLRWSVCPARSPGEVNRAVKRFKNRSGTKAGVYLLLRCPSGLRRTDVVRGALSGAFQVLYIGLSETEHRHRAAQLACGLVGDKPRHDAAKQVLGDPDLQASDDLQLLLCSFSPAFSLEDFLLNEHVRRFGDLPPFNHGRSTRPSTHLRKMARRINWDMLVRPWAE